MCLLTWNQWGETPCITRMSNSGIYFGDGWHIRISFRSNCFHSLLHPALDCLAFPEVFPSWELLFLCSYGLSSENYQTPPCPHLEELPGRRKAVTMQKKRFLQRLDPANLPCLGIFFIPSTFVLTFDKSHLW